MKPQPPRTPSKLPDSIHHQLNMYALAASAAGVGMLALAQPIEGKIIYTKANKYIGPYTTFHLDLNHDRIADFGFMNHGSTSFGSPFGYLVIYPEAQNNAIVGRMLSSGGGHKWYLASALSAHVQIGPKRKFFSFQETMAASNGSGAQFGLWCNVAHRYLGLKFTIMGKTHFAWARLNVNCSGYVLPTLTGYAY